MVELSNCRTVELWNWGIVAQWNGGIGKGGMLELWKGGIVIYFICESSNCGLSTVDPCNCVTVSIRAFNSQITEHRSQITEYRIPITEHRTPITDHRTPNTEHRLPTNRLPIRQFYKRKQLRTNHKRFFHTVPGFFSLLFFHFVQPDDGTGNG